MLCHVKSVRLFGGVVHLDGDVLPVAAMFSDDRHGDGSTLKIQGPRSIIRIAEIVSYIGKVGVRRVVGWPYMDVGLGS
jgi:hypothetical protein